MLRRMALRNLLRQKRRSGFALAILAVGFLALALAGGFMAQTFRALSEGAILGGLGHLQVLPESPEEGALLPEDPSREARLAADPAVRAVLPRIELMGLLSAGGRSRAVLATAVAPDAEYRHLDGAARLSSGRWVEAGGALLGLGLAQALGVKPGDALNLMATLPDGAVNAIELRVSGLQDLGMKELNDRSLLLSLEDGERLLDRPGARSRLSLVLFKPERLDAARAHLAPLAGPQTRMATWREGAAFYQQVRLLYFAIFGFLGLVLALVVLLAVSALLMMGVLERMREFATLRALGLEPARLLGLIQLEAAWLGLAGSLLGLLLTLGLRALLNALHLQLPPPPGTSHGYELRIAFVPGITLGVALALQAVVQAAALLPALKALKLRISEALRHA